MQADWAVAPGQTPDGRNYIRKIATDTQGHIIASGDKRPARAYQGRLMKINGVTGAVEWLNDNYVGAEYFYALAVKGVDSYVGGRVDGTEIDPFGLGAFNTTDDVGFFSKVDTGGTHLWAKMMGSRVYSIEASPSTDHIYVTGFISAAWTEGSCSLTGLSGAYVAKMNTADGSCVWAKDIGSCYWKLAATPSALYGACYDDEPLVMDTDLTIRTRGPESDALIVKWDVTDGAGHWGTSIGGSGDDYAYGIGVSSSGGLLVTGRTTSDTFDMNGVTLNNLQHARAEAATGETGPVNSGERAMFIAELSATEVAFSCLSSCTTSTTTATVNSGYCFVDNQCVAHNSPSPFMACMMCDTSLSQRVAGFNGPDTTNHCYMDGACQPAGAIAPAYMRYNSPSVCEECNPTVNPTGYSVRQGYIHDRDLALAENGRNGRRLGTQTNIFNMVFDVSSNGCQVLPSLAVPAGTAGLTAAAAAQAVATAASPTTAQLTALAALTAHATSENAMLADAVNKVSHFSNLSPAVVADALRILAVDAVAVGSMMAHLGDNTDSLAAWQTAWAFYSGNEATCTMPAFSSMATDTTAGISTCVYTPSNTAASMARAFGTNLHYGHSVSVIKVQQSLALGAANAESAAPDATHGAAFLLDVQMHTIVPYMQCAIHAAYLMDNAATADLKKAAQAKGWACYSIFAPAVAGAPSVAPMMRFNPISTVETNNYCYIKSFIESNLPNASTLQYTMGHAAGSVGSVTESGDLLHLTLEDLGGLMVDGVQVPASTCASFVPPTAVSAEPDATHTQQVSTTVTIADATVADFTPAVKEGMRSNIALRLGVTINNVAIAIQPSTGRRLQSGGVVLQITVYSPTAAANTAIQSTMVSALSTSAGVAALLSTPGRPIDAADVTPVSSDAIVIQVTVETKDSGLSDGEMVAIIVAAVVVALLLLLLLCMCMRNKQSGKPIFTCLEETPKPSGGSA